MMNWGSGSRLLLVTALLLPLRSTATGSQQASSLRSQAGAPSVASIVSTLDDVLKFINTEEGSAQKSNDEKDKWCKDALGDLKGALKSERNALTDLQGELSEVQSNKAELEATVTDSEQKVSACHDELNTLSDKLTKLRASNHDETEKLNAEITKLDDAISEQAKKGGKDKVAALKSDREKLRADLEKAREDYQTEAANLKDLQAEQDKQLLDLNDQLAQARPSLTLAQETISSNELKIKNAKKAKGSLDNLLKSTKAECDKHKKDSGKQEGLRRDQITSVKSAIALVKPLGSSLLQESAELEDGGAGLSFLQARSTLTRFAPTAANPFDTAAAQAARSSMSALLGLGSASAAVSTPMFEGTSAEALARGAAALEAPPTAPAAQMPLSPPQQQQQQERRSAPLATSELQAAVAMYTATELQAGANSQMLDTSAILDSAQAGADPFASVKKMIVEMLAKLKEEANGDLSKAQSCELNMRKNKMAVFRAKNKLLAAQAGVRNYKAAIDEAQSDAQLAGEEATKLQEEDARITALLQEQLKEAARMMASNAQAVTVLKEVVNVVQQLFPSLVQVDASPGVVLAQAGTGVQTHKVRAASDVVEQVNQAIKALEDQNAELDKSTGELQVMIAGGGDGGLKKAYASAIKAAKKQVKAAESAQVTASDALIAQQQDAKKAKATIEQLGSEKNMLDEDCGPGMDEQDVAEAREQEIKGLKNALAVLEGDELPGLIQTSGM